MSETNTKNDNKAGRAAWITAGILCTAAIMWCVLAGARLAGAAFCFVAFALGMLEHAMSSRHEVKV